MGKIKIVQNGLLPAGAARRKLEQGAATVVATLSTTAVYSHAIKAALLAQKERAVRKNAIAIGPKNVQNLELASAFGRRDQDRRNGEQRQKLLELHRDPPSLPLSTYGVISKATPSL